MLDRLQKKWNVSIGQLCVILLVFALGGSLTGFLAKKVMAWFEIEQALIWTVSYILILTLLWPVLVLFMSIPFGQYSFFKNYLIKMGRRMKIIK